MQQLERWILFPRHLLGAPLKRPSRVAGLEPLVLESPEGEVEGWFLPPFDGKTGEKQPVVIFGHGNGELIDDWPIALETYRQMGLALFLPEYRGYGRSCGTPSEAAITEDMIGFYDQLIHRADVDGTRVVLHGRSLGGGVVCALARHRPAAGLILESTFTSIVDIARNWHLPSALLSNRFESETVVRSFPHPVLIFHGTRDRVIPYSHALELERAAKHGKLVTYDCDHNDMPHERGGFWVEVERYLRETLQPPVI